MVIPATQVKNNFTAYDLITDHRLLGKRFENPSFFSLKVLCKATNGLSMNAQEEAFFRARCGGRNPPTRKPSEFWNDSARRTAKTLAIALHATACLFRDYSPYLMVGQRVTAMIIASDRKQASNAMDYIDGFVQEIPMLRDMVIKQTNESIQFSNRMNIDVHTASFKSTRGYHPVFVGGDETAYWPTDESANPDREIFNALRPGMAQFPDALLMAASSPYLKRGELYRMHKEYFGKNDPDILVWQSDTASMNPVYPQAWIDRAYRDDPGRARAEYGGLFRDDRISVFDIDTLREKFVIGCRELAYREGQESKAAFDPSGGSGGDSAAGAIGHEENGRLILDAVREYRPPFNPSAITEDFCKLLRSYKINAVHGDKYGGDWVTGPFKENGITYEQYNKGKSELYQDLVPLVNSGEVELLDNETLITQLTLLERRTGRGRIKIDHPHGGHDDTANAVALLFDLFRDESSDLFFVDPEKPFAPAAEEIYQQEQKQIREVRREKAERVKDGSDFFSQSVSMKKIDF